VDEPAVVRDRAVGADEDVVGHGLAEDLDLEDVRDQLLRLPVDVGVHERDVVVRGDDVAERGQPLLDPLDLHRVRERVAQVLELLVRRRARHEQPVPVPCHALSTCPCTVSEKGRRAHRT
jgi:hypothetical protein